MIWLVLGGARSGKSVVAERLVSGLVTPVTPVAPVTYVATMRLDESDPDLVARVTAHRARRPDDWRTVEAGADLAGVLLECAGTVLVDSLGPWVAGSFMDGGDTMADRIALAPAETMRLCAALVERTGDTVVVSEEVGFGVHPSTEGGRVFRDLLGSLNQAVSSVADEVYFVIAGRAVRLPDLFGSS